MKPLDASSKIEIPAIDVIQTGYWAPFNVIHGIGKHSLLGSSLSYGDVIEQLPPDADAFMIGTQIQLYDGDPQNNAPTHEILKLNGHVYVPDAKCSFVPLSEVEAKNPDLLDLMLKWQLSSALKVTNGYLAYNPAFVHIVK